MFFALAEQRKTIASRSTNVTFERSSATFRTPVFSWARVRSSSPIYSLVNWPHNHTFTDFSSCRTGVIFSTVSCLLRISLHTSGHYHDYHEMPRNACLLIFSALILDSSVEAGMPRR